MSIQKVLRLTYQARGGLTGLTDVRAQVYLNGAAKAVGVNAVALTERDAVNAPGIYDLVLTAAQLTAMGVVSRVGTDEKNVISGVVDSFTEPSPAPFRVELTLADADDLEGAIAEVSETLGDVGADVALVRVDIAALSTKVDAAQSSLNDLSTAVAGAASEAAGANEQASYARTAAEAARNAVLDGTSGNAAIRTAIDGTRSVVDDTNSKVGQLLSSGSNSDAALAASIAALSTKVDSLQNNTNFEAQLLDETVKPAAGQKVIRVPITIQNSEGSVEDPDGNEIRVALADVEGTDYSSRLVGATYVPGTPGSPGGSGGGAPYGGVVPALLLPFDGDLGDQGPNAYAPTTFGSPSFGAGKFGSAVDLQGGGLYFNGAPGLNLGSGDFTVEFWAKSFEMEAREVFTYNDPTGLAQGGIIMGVGAQGITLRAFGDDGFELQNFAYNHDSGYDFNHFAFTRQDNEMFRLYVNGDLVNQFSAFSDLGSNHQITIGSNAGFPGFVDDFRIVKGQALYTGNAVGTPSAAFPLGSGGGGSTPATPASPGYVTAIRDAAGEYHVDMRVSTADEEEQLLMAFSYVEDGKAFRKSRVTRLVNDLASEGFALETTLQQVKSIAQGAASEAAGANTEASSANTRAGIIASLLQDPSIGLQAIKEAIVNGGVDLSPVLNLISAVQATVDSTEHGNAALKAYVSDAATGIPAVLALLGNGTYGLQAMQAMLSSGDYGLAVIKALGDQIKAQNDAIATALQNVGTEVEGVYDETQLIKGQNFLSTRDSLAAISARLSAQGGRVV